MEAPVSVAGRAPVAHQSPGQPPAVRTGAWQPHRPWLWGPLDAVSSPVLVAHRAAPLVQPGPGRIGASTDAAGAGGHAAHRQSAVAACYGRPDAIMTLPPPPRPARPQRRGALAAGAAPVLKASVAPVAAKPRRDLAADAARALCHPFSRPQTCGALAAVSIPVLVARRAAPTRWYRGRFPTVRAGPRGCGAAHGLGGPLDAVATPVERAPLAAAVGEPAAGRVGPPTDVTGARGHATAAPTGAQGARGRT
jgi:hypothetical protein